MFLASDGVEGRQIAKNARHPSAIDPGQIARRENRLNSEFVDRRIPGVTNSPKKTPDHPIRRRNEAISAVKLSETLTRDVDAWAEAHETVRSDAIRQLVELGLSATPSAGRVGTIRRDPVEIEHLAVKQIDQLLDPSLPGEERKRRIRRLTEGPPEFTDERIDLPKPKT